jgi:hypothetical protein
MPTHHTGDQTSDEALAALYARFLEDIRQRLAHTTTLSAEAFQAVAQAVRESLGQSGEVRQDDLQQVLDSIVAHWQQVFTESVHAPHAPHASATVQAMAEQGMALLAHLAGVVKTMAGEVESRLQQELEYHTGTVVGAGNFFCVQCDTDIQKVKAGPLPPCSNCHGTVFRRRW